MNIITAATFRARKEKNFLFGKAVEKNNYTAVYPREQTLDWLIIAERSVSSITSIFMERKKKSLLFSKGVRCHVNKEHNVSVPSLQTFYRNTKEL